MELLQVVLTSRRPKDRALPGALYTIYNVCSLQSGKYTAGSGTLTANLFFLQTLLPALTARGSSSRATPRSSHPAFRANLHPYMSSRSHPRRQKPLLSSDTLDAP
ncbi:hypothetical protein PC118_g3135 [Phytophthora cactorum]|uniref:Uncharacterized protein n=1 Tax=Phytophthora cactorum TaxID=29920 RepID=A0A8T1GMW5_9STRA|nr:hypothetical protein PC118_g3135 [Phytophthora cactorum]KAG3021163.1 hypothetical protein PC119_g9714 [Phytophthora cactorum]KAG3082474.1 hypothetical protein PC121_g6080 [Phytophthora cactorum]